MYYVGHLLIKVSRKERKGIKNAKSAKKNDFADFAKTFATLREKPNLLAIFFVTILHFKQYISIKISI